MKKLRSAGITLLILAAAVFVLRRFNLFPDIGKWFRSQPVLIENTPILVENIRDLSQLITIVAFDEVVMTRSGTEEGDYVENVLENRTLDKPDERKISLIVRGKIFAGTDLKKLTEKDLFVKGDSAAITLPPAVVMEAVVNPSDCEIFIEKGHWETQEVTTLKIQARQHMINRAVAKHLLQKADARAASVVENFLRSVGFKRVRVSTRK